MSKCVNRVMKPEAEGYALCVWSNWTGSWRSFVYADASKRDLVAACYEQLVGLLGFDLSCAVVPLASLDEAAISDAVSRLPVPDNARFVDPAPDGVVMVQ